MYSLKERSATLFPPCYSFVSGFMLSLLSIWLQSYTVSLSVLERERDALNEELTVVAELIQKVVDENARTAQNQDKYREKYDSLVARFEKAKERIAEIARLKSDKESRRLQADSFMKELKKLDRLVTEFDEKLWYTLVDRIMVYSKEDIRFVFRDGAEIKI